jgi:hypothetical protein
MEEQKEALIDLINEAEGYYQADFILHFKDSEKTKYKCACLPCGFHSSEDPIECPNKHLHQGVCSRCFDSFSIFPKINTWISRVKEMQMSPALDDDIHFLEHEVKTCRQNLIDFRAHQVLKYDEKEADKEELLALKPNQAIVISDWKMKIIQQCFREKQEEFFGKRGTSLIGFMTISNQEGEVNGSADKDVTFNFMLTDDTTQDNTSVNAAKCLLYQKFLPAHVTEVLFRADGAGCFSSNVTKVASRYWEQWTGIKEISNRQSPAGGGKTNLDGQFGVFQRQMSDRVDEGKNIHEN